MKLVCDILTILLYEIKKKHFKKAMKEIQKAIDKRLLNLN